MLLDRILELEAAVARRPSSPTPHSPNAQPPSHTPTAFPRALQSAHAQSAFQANLHEALDEVRSEDPSLDPLYTSRHIGPQARKRQLDEMKEREEEEARDARKAPRRGKAATAPTPSKAKDAGGPPSFPPPGNGGGSPATIDPEQYTANDGDSAPLRNANGNNTLDTPNQLGPGSPTSLGPSAPSIPSTTVQRHTKPKRLKAHTVTSKSYSIPMVPRDKNGRPILPLNVGIMTVNCLGEVCMREHFHTERYIFPVGYSVNR